MRLKQQAADGDTVLQMYKVTSPKKILDPLQDIKIASMTSLFILDTVEKLLPSILLFSSIISVVVIISLSCLSVISMRN